MNIMNNFIATVLKNAKEYEKEGLVLINDWEEKFREDYKYF